MRRGKRRKNLFLFNISSFPNRWDCVQFVKESTNSTKLLQVVSLKRSMINIGEFGKSFISPELARIIVSCISSPSPDDRHASKADPPSLSFSFRWANIRRQRRWEKMHRFFFLSFSCGGEIPSHARGKLEEDMKCTTEEEEEGTMHLSATSTTASRERFRGGENEKCFSLHLLLSPKSSIKVHFLSPSASSSKGKQTRILFLPSYSGTLSPSPLY